MPKVFIIILHWNGSEDTLECLKSLEKIDYPNYQIVVVDNGSTKKFKVQSSKFKVIDSEENLGFAGGNNVGIKYALEQGADYILLLNNDTLVSQDFLKKLVEIGESNEKFGILGPKIYFYSQQCNIIPSKARNPERIWAGSFGRPNGLPQDSVWFAGGQVNWLYNKGEMRGYGEIDKGQYDQPQIQETDYLTGCCLLIKRAVIEKIGLMPEEYFLYYEDTDWSLKAQKAGFKCIFVPAAKIWHKGSKSSQPGSPSYIYYHIRNGLILAQRYAPWPIKIFVHLDVGWRIFKQLVKLIFFPKKRLWAKYILKGIKDFYLGRYGKIAMRVSS